MDNNELARELTMLANHAAGEVRRRLAAGGTSRDVDEWKTVAIKLGELANRCSEAGKPDGIARPGTAV